MPAQEFNMGAISEGNKRWTIDSVNSTDTHEAWMPTTHKMSKTDFNSIIRHPSMTAQSKKVKGKKSGLSVVWSIPGGYVTSGGYKYPVKKFNIVNRRERSLLIHWFSTPKEHVHGKKTEAVSSDDEDDVVAPVVPAGRVPRAGRSQKAASVRNTLKSNAARPSNLPTVKHVPATSRARPTQPSSIPAITANRALPPAAVGSPGIAYRGAHWTDRQREQYARLDETESRFDSMKEMLFKRMDELLAEIRNLCN